MKTIIPALLLCVNLAVFSQDKKAPEATQTEKPAAEATQKSAEPKLTLKVKKSDEEWRAVLSDEQYRVARKAGTERSHGKAYEEFNAQGEGTYYCVCCASELFTSSTKFHSGCGWPSFYDQSKAKNVLERADVDGHRIEVLCKVCDAHLGHVFEGEGFKTPTDRRFCINGVAMTFVEKGGKAPEPKGKQEEKK
jgi:peptide-methionine (R)-S-oxide reductase